MNIVTTETTRTTNASSQTTGTRQAAIHGLAIVGFGTLVIAGMTLAVFTARFVPEAVTSLGSAAVSLSSFFIPAPKPALTVVPNATTTIPFDDSVATSTPATTTPSTTTPVPPEHIVKIPPTPTQGSQTSNTYQIGGTTGTPNLYGLPDLVSTITAVGYLSSTSTDTFIATNVIPAHTKVAVKFSITNQGTNKTGVWRFSASIPTETAYIFQSQPQQSLNPGDHIEYILGFDQATPGSNKTISVSANYDNGVAESNSQNNSTSAQVTIFGS